LPPCFFQFFRWSLVIVPQFAGPGFEGAAASKQWLVEWGDYWERERESPGATGKLA